MTKITHTKRNPHAESFQVVFDPEILIREVHRLERLVKNFYFSADSVICIGDIFERCNEECGLAIPRTKSEYRLPNLAYDTSAFNFPYIAWSP